MRTNEAAAAEGEGGDPKKRISGFIAGPISGLPAAGLALVILTATGESGPQVSRWMSDVSAWSGAGRP